MKDLTDQIKPIIESLQTQIWEAEHFISIDANAKYWSGFKDGNQITLNGFQAVGISVSEITDKMVKPDFNQIHGVV